MPKKSFDRLPYSPIVKIDQDEPIRPTDVTPILEERIDGVTLCVRSSAVDDAKENRGGYFFHVAPNREHPDQYFLKDFEGKYVKKTDGSIITFNINDLCKLINHCTGVEFNEEYLILSQLEINFRSDPGD